MVEWTRAAPPALYDRRTTTKTRRRLTLATVDAIAVAASVALARPFGALCNGCNRGLERFASFYGQLTARLVLLMTRIHAVYGGLRGMTGGQCGRGTPGCTPA